MFSQVDDYNDLNQTTKIKVFGVGGGGCNAVERMIENGVSDVEFVNVNTDSQVLRTSKADRKILIGRNLTGGLGAGTNVEIGRQAALESIDELRNEVSGCDMVFITSGLGGGTGSGATPILCKVAREEGCLSVGVVTKPFTFEGDDRMAIANEAIEEMRKYVDALIVIPNDRLIQMAGRETPTANSFNAADNVLRQAVQGITEIISAQATINVDFADVRTIMKDQGTAIMGIGYATGATKTFDAAHGAIKSPLLETSIFGARRAIVNITSDVKFSVIECREIIEEIKKASGTNFDQKFKWGYAVNPNFDDEVVVTVIATGFEKDYLNNLKNKSFDVKDEDELSIIEIEMPKNKKRFERRNKKKGNSSDDVSLPSWLSRK